MRRMSRSKRNGEIQSQIPTPALQNQEDKGGATRSGYVLNTLLRGRGWSGFGRDLGVEAMRLYTEVKNVFVRVPGF